MFRDNYVGHIWRQTDTFLHTWSIRIQDRFAVLTIYAVTSLLNCFSRLLVVPKLVKRRFCFRIMDKYKAYSKKRPNVCYKDFILQHFKHCPLHSSPLYWRYTVPNVSSIVGMLPGTQFLWWGAVFLSHFPESPRVKKMRNFLNSAPTSTEGALGALSSSSALFKKFGLFLNTGMYLSP